MQGPSIRPPTPTATAAAAAGAAAGDRPSAGFGVRRVFVRGV